MAVVTVKSTLIQNAEASPVIMNDSYFAGSPGKSFTETVEVTNGNSIASVYVFGRVKSWQRVGAIWLFCDAITSAAADIGLHQTAENGGAAADEDLFASAQSIATAITVGTNVRFEAADIANAKKRVWELLGLSSDPKRDYELTAKLTAAATATGTLTLAWTVFE